jgi:uncharacterized protein YdeI (YjbR/CyaY-like superfamily)
MKYTDGIEMYYAKDKATWRKWLEKNSKKTKAVWLVYYKKGSGKTRVSYSDAVDEALCFGWIDSKPNKIDEDKYIQFFTARNPKSKWSKVNKAKVDRLIKEGKMMPEGLAVIDGAKQNGAWDALNEVEELTIPEDLLIGFKKEKKAYDHFLAFPKSSKKIILQWISEAKQPETRSKRIAESIRLAKENIRANHYRQPKKKSVK